MGWDRLQPGVEIYIPIAFTIDSVAGSTGPCAQGPYTVVCCQQRLARSATGELCNFHSFSTVLVKKGPTVVVGFHNHRFTGFYADVPLNVILIEEQSSPASHVTKTGRPQSIQLLPTEMDRHIGTDLGRGWQGLYGQYEVVPVAPAVPRNKKIMVIKHGAVAKALAVALVARNTSFEYVAREADGVFYLDPDDWNWALQQVPDRTIVGFQL